MSPSVVVVVPCYNEADFVAELIAGLLASTPTAAPWRFVFVDDSSTDATGRILDAAAARDDRVTSVHGQFGSPGGARSAGVAHAAETHGAADWVITLDADVELGVGWFDRWSATLQTVDHDETIGAVNGVELQDHLFVDLPNARRVSAAFGLGLERAEGLIGPTNLNGVNHAIRWSTYLTAGPYVQPTAPGIDGPVYLAGEDWDLGVRVRLAGFGVAATGAAVVDRGRRLLADVHAYASGEAYEGAFRRLTSSTPSVDVPAADTVALIDLAIDRSLRHFLLKPILAGAVSLDAATGLSPSTRAAMEQWMLRWPFPSFAESRNGFIFGRLARFADAFTATIRADLDLTLPDVVTPENS